MTPFLNDIPPLISSRPLPKAVAPARGAWRDAIRLSRKDPLAAARAFVKIAELLKEASGDALHGEAIVSTRLVALENALDAADAVDQRKVIEAELERLVQCEPALQAGVTRLLQGDRESEENVPAMQIIRG